jgi:hypothetical protein
MKRPATTVLTVILFAACSQVVAQDSKPSKLVIENKSQQQVHLFWFNYDSKEVDHGLIGPSKTQKFDTYVGHEWRLRRDGKLLEIIKITDSPSQSVVIRGSTPISMPEIAGNWKDGNDFSIIIAVDGKKVNATMLRKGGQRHWDKAEGEFVENGSKLKLTHYKGDKSYDTQVGSFSNQERRITWGNGTKWNFVPWPPEGWTSYKKDGKVWYFDGNRTTFDENQMREYVGLTALPTKEAPVASMIAPAGRYPHHDHTVGGNSTNKDIRVFAIHHTGSVEPNNFAPLRPNESRMFPSFVGERFLITDDTGTATATHKWSRLVYDKYLTKTEPFVTLRDARIAKYKVRTLLANTASEKMDVVVDETVEFQIVNDLQVEIGFVNRWSARVDQTFSYQDEKGRNFDAVVKTSYKKPGDTKVIPPGQTVTVTGNVRQGYALLNLAEIGLIREIQPIYGQPKVYASTRNYPRRHWLIDHDNPILDPIGDQGKEGACVAWTVCGALGTSFLRDYYDARNDASQSATSFTRKGVTLFDARDLYRQREDTSEEGWFIAKALKEAEVYTVQFRNRLPDYPGYGIRLRERGWKRIVSKDDMCWYLSRDFPLMASFDTFTDGTKWLGLEVFRGESTFNQAAAEAEVYTGPKLSNKPVDAGGHAVMVMGYNRLKRYGSAKHGSLSNLDSRFQRFPDKLKTNFWSIHNSWGKDWGTHGYVDMAENACDIDDEMFVALNWYLCDVHGREVTDEQQIQDVMAQAISVHR